MEPLEEMARVNVMESLARELPTRYRLEVRSPVYTDSRLMPHEWILRDGQLLKTDAVDHGDDHLFPGPLDVCWDLAGAVVEWMLSGSETHSLLQEFRSLIGDDARPRLPEYLIAYCAFRVGVAVFAGQSGNRDEQRRWRAAETRYRRYLLTALSLRDYA